MAEKRIIARFHPQAWQNDYAIGVDPLGPVQADVTEEVLVLSPSERAELVDDSYRTDELRYALAAPDWWAEWDGPFYISVQDSIEEYFAVREAA